MRMRRIILANDSRLLREMLNRAFNKVDGLQVVQELIDIADVDDAVEQMSPDWLVVSPSQAEHITETLEKHPDVRVITVSPDGSQIRMMCRGNYEEKLDGSSLSDLLSILRDEKEVSLK